YLVVHRIEPYNAVHGVQGTVLPGPYIGYDAVGDLHKDVVGYLRVVHFLDMGRDVPVAHPKAIEAQDLIGEVVRQNGLPLFHDLRLKAAVAVLGRAELESARARPEGLLFLPIALVALGTLRLAQMGLHLGLKGLVKKIPEQGRKGAVLAEKALSGGELFKGL